MQRMEEIKSPLSASLEETVQGLPQAVEAVGAAYISTAYRDAFSFIILFIVLFVKPTGLLNKKIENKL